MATLFATQFIRRAPHDVFTTITRVHEFPTWNPRRNPSARKVSEGEIGEGTEFELEIKGFGRVRQTLEEFVPDRQARVVPHIRMLRGGHRFKLRPEGTGTRVDHELEMVPKGVFRLMMPMMWLTGKKNLRDTMKALQEHLEGAAVPPQASTVRAERPRG